MVHTKPAPAKTFYSYGRGHKVKETGSIIYIFIAPIRSFQNTSGYAFCSLYCWSLACHLLVLRDLCVERFRIFSCSYRTGHYSVSVRSNQKSITADFLKSGLCQLRYGCGALPAGRRTILKKHTAVAFAYFCALLANTYA